MRLSTNAFMTAAQGQDVECCVDYVSVAGNGFARTISGDGVFLNRRMTDKLKLSEGDILKARVLPNFPDKQESCKYRAVHVDAVGSIFEQSGPGTVVPGPEYDETNVKNLVLETLKVGPLSTGTITRMLKIESYKVSNACKTLHDEGHISRADIYRTNKQSKASRRIWTLSDSEFEIDPEIDSINVEA